MRLVDLRVKHKGSYSRTDPAVNVCMQEKYTVAHPLVGPIRIDHITGSLRGDLCPEGASRITAEDEGRRREGLR